MGDKKEDYPAESSTYPRPAMLYGPIDPVMIYGPGYPDNPVLPETAPWYPPTYPGGLPVPSVTITVADAAQEKVFLKPAILKGMAVLEIFRFLQECVTEILLRATSQELLTLKAYARTLLGDLEK